MEDIKRILKECLIECENVGIKYGKIDGISVNRKLRTTWGVCRKKIINGNEVFFIEINKELADNKKLFNSMQNTIMHEVLHTVKGCHNHSKNWKYFAELINKKYPKYNIKRTTSREEKFLKPIEINYKYVFKCTGCGQTIKRQRNTNFEKRYLCGICGNRFVKNKNP